MKEQSLLSDGMFNRGGYREDSKTKKPNYKPTTRNINNKINFEKGRKILTPNEQIIGDVSVLKELVNNLYNQIKNGEKLTEGKLTLVECSVNILRKTFDKVGE